MLDSNPAKLVFVTDTVGTRRRGAQKVRWSEQEKRDLTSIVRDRHARSYEV